MPEKITVCLIHWNDNEADARVREINAKGFEGWRPPREGGGIKAIRDRRPDAILIDLARLPSHGRDVALSVRGTKALRNVPLVFMGGDIEKLAGIKMLLPDATYAEWSAVSRAVKQAIKNAPANPVIPASGLAGYSGTPLPKKLGIKPNYKVTMIDAPPNFDALSDGIPEKVVLQRVTMKSAPQELLRADLGLWFVKVKKVLDANIARIAEKCPSGGLWIIWPKSASNVASDVREPVVREVGLANGLVDYKVCAVDATWAGLKFAKRKPGGKRKGPY